MSLIVETGQVTFPTSATGSETVTLSKFSASEPVKVVLFIATAQTTATGGSTGHTSHVCGASDGTTEGCTFSFSEHGSVRSNGFRVHDDVAIQFYNSSKTLIGEATVTSLADDEIQLSYSSITGGGWKVQFVAFGGTDLENAAVVNWREPYSGESEPRFIDCGFTPNAMISMGSQLYRGASDSIFSIADDMGGTLGFAAGSDNYCVAWNSDDNRPTTREITYTGDFTCRDYLVTEFTYNLVNTTFTTDGFNVTVTNKNVPANNSYQHTAIVFKTSSTTSITFHEVTSPTSTGTQDFTDTDMEIQAVLAIGSGLEKGYTNLHGRFAFSVFDGTDTNLLGWNQEDNVTPADNYQWWRDDTFIRTYDDSTGSENLDASLTFPSADTARLTWNTVDSVATTFGLLTFSAEPGNAVGNTLGLTDSVFSNTVQLTVNDAFSFTSGVDLATFLRLASNVIFADPQTAEHNYFYLEVSQTFLSDVTGADYEEELIQYLGFTGPRVFEDCGNFFGFEDASRIGVNASASNAFDFIEHDNILFYPLAGTITYRGDDVLGFIDTAIASRNENVYEYFAFDQSLSTDDTDFGRQESQGFISDSVTFSISGANCPDKEYTPFVGAGDSGVYAPVSVTPPSLSQDTLTLYYPHDTPTTTLVLKNPEFQNVEQTSFAKIDRTTRGGDRKIFSDLEWPKVELLRFTIVNICEVVTPVQSVVDFLNLTRGKKIRLKDWEGRNWNGIINTPNTDISQRVGGYALSIEFEGVLA